MGEGGRGVYRQACAKPNLNEKTLKKTEKIVLVGGVKSQLGGGESLRGGVKISLATSL